jgi:hypothetical protein
MRLVALMLLLLLVSVKPAFCVGKPFPVDTTKHIVIRHPVKHPLRANRPKPWLTDNEFHYLDCVFTREYSIAQRLRKYPFSKAIKILAVSYNGGAEPNKDIVVGEDTAKKIKTKPYGLLIQKGMLDTASLFEVKQLTPKQIAGLTNMMFNTDIKVHYNFDNYADPGVKCFQPRNAFIFIDKNEKVFDYVEICFECRNTESESGRIHIENCNQSLEMTKKFLIDLGIKFGTLTTNTADMK